MLIVRGCFFYCSLFYSPQLALRVFVMVEGRRWPVSVARMVVSWQMGP